MSITYSHHTILITGGSSGIGAAFARALAARGANLVLVARRIDRLEVLAAELRTLGVTVTPIAQDLSSPTAGADLVRAIGDLEITGVVNNAGFGTFGPFADDNVDHLMTEIAVDVAAPVLLTSAFLPAMLAAGRGFIINVASMSAYAPTPRMAVYGASKAFVLSFTESLWAELRGTGVVAFALSPGATSTEFNAVVGTDDATAGARMRSAEDVVATALAHLEKRDPGPSVIDGAGNRIGAALTRVPGRRQTVTMMLRMTDPARRQTATRTPASTSS